MSTSEGVERSCKNGMACKNLDVISKTIKFEMKTDAYLYKFFLENVGVKKEEILHG